MKELISQIPAPMYIYDIKTLRISAINEVFTEQFGYSEESALLMTVYDLFPESERDALKKKCAEQQGCSQIKGDWHHIRQDGTAVSVSIQSRSILFDGNEFRAAVITDVSDLKKAERELASEKKLLWTMIHSIPDPVWVKDTEGVYLICNSMMERLLGVLESEIIGKTDYHFTDKKTADLFTKNDRKAMETGGPGYK